MCALESGGVFLKRVGVKEAIRCGRKKRMRSHGEVKKQKQPVYQITPNSAQTGHVYDGALDANELDGLCNVKQIGKADLRHQRIVEPQSGIDCCHRTPVDGWWWWFGDSGSWGWW